MTKAATKEAMKADAKMASLKTRLKNNLHNISDAECEELAKGLINKYGNDKANEIAYNCLMRPYEMNKALGNDNKKCTSRSMLEYFNKEKRSDKILNTALSPKGATSKTATSTKDKSPAKGQNNTGNKKIDKDKTKAEMQKDKEAANKRIADAKEKENARRAEAARKREAAKNAEKAKKEAEAKREALKQANIKAFKDYQFKPKPISEIATATPKKATPAKTTTSTTKKRAVAAANKGSNTGNNNKPAPTNNQGTENGNFSWANNNQGLKYESFGPKITTPEEKLKQAKGNKGYITFDDLTKAGIDVSSKDFQTIVNRQKTLADKAKIITSITPGKKSEDLANWMIKNTRGGADGACLTGPQNGMTYGVYGSDTKNPIAASNKQWSDYKVKGKTGNSACDAHNLLDRSGDWFTVDVPNKAYHNPAGNKEMWAFNNQLKTGTIGSTDNRAIQGAKGVQFEVNTKSAKHGHIWVKGKNGKNLCDGIQSETGIDFSRYGKEMHVTLSSDSKIPDDLALEMIKTAEKRREQYSMLREEYRANNTRR